MKASVLGLLIATVAFGASTVYLTLQLREERAQADKVADAMLALNARIAGLEKARSERHFATANPFAAAMSPGGPPPDQTFRAEQKSVPEGQVAESVTINAPPPRNAETFQRMMRKQVRARNKQLYADVGVRLGLDKDEANKLIDLLTEQQIQDRRSWGESTGTEDMLRQLQDKQREDKTKIADLIGDDKAKSLEEYQQSLPARLELDMLARQFDGADSPLNEEQQKRLLAVLVDERTRSPAPKMAEATSIEEYSKAYDAWQSDYDESVASQARAIFNPEQLATFHEYSEWQQQMRSQMSAMGGGRVLRVPGGPSLMYPTSATIVNADLAIASPAPADKPRK
ncbi:MAG: hypothetical protein ABI769_10550 [Pseudomonadota bacterium]